MLGVAALLYFSIPLLARIASKEPAKVCERLLLIARGAKLIRRLVRSPFPTLTLTTLLALLQARRALSHAYNFLLAFTPADRVLPCLL
jgi:hypothetical protein